MRQAETLLSKLRSKSWQLRCVESCTAGGLSAAFGAVSGASDVLDRSWVTYSNQAKIEEVSVDEDLLKAFGAVSAEVVIAMANGAVVGAEHNTVAISISGIAGPGGGSSDKPVGTVFMGFKFPQQAAFAEHYLFTGSRTEIQEKAINQAIKSVLSFAFD
ncbi:MAG: hypothetical protein AUK35_10255 [Zetaproteobacteria bacterium CG2_30_46_52]|nr:MAG: hypothetical protein AUK35_10255 [Zetaproteobacteria bacterium CG2_30_46_52]